MAFALNMWISAVNPNSLFFTDFMVVTCPAMSVPDGSKISFWFSVSLRFCCCGGCQELYRLELELKSSILGVLHPSSRQWIHIKRECFLVLHHLCLESCPELWSTHSSCLLLPGVYPPASVHLAAEGLNEILFRQLAPQAALPVWRPTSTLEHCCGEPAIQMSLQDWSESGDLTEKWILTFYFFPILLPGSHHHHCWSPSIVHHLHLNIWFRVYCWETQSKVSKSVSHIFYF